MLRKKKYAAIFLAIPIVLLLFLLALLPYLISLERYKGLVAAQLGRALGREVTIGELRLTILSGLGVEARGLRIANSKAFGPKPFLEADAVKVHLRPWPLLRGRLEFSRALVTNPRFLIQRNRQGLWSYDDLAKAYPLSAPSPSKKAAREKGAPLLAPLPSELALFGGEVIFIDLGQLPASPLRFQDVQVHLSQGSPPSSIRFQSTATMAKAQVELTGRATPLGEGPVLKRLDLEARLRVQDLDVAPFLPYLALPHGIQVGGKASIDLKANGKGEALMIEADADLKGLAMRLGLFEKEIGEGGELKVKGWLRPSSLDLEKTSLTLKNSKLEGSLKVDGFEVPQVKFRLHSKSLSLDRLLLPTPPQAQAMATPHPRAMALTSPPGKGVEKREMRFQMEGDLQVDRLQWKDLELSPFSTHILYRGQVLRLDGVSFALFGGQGRGRAELDFRSPSPRTTLAFRLEGAQMGPLLKATMAPKWGLSGALDLEAKLRMAGLDAAQVKGTARGDGTFRLRGGRFSGFKPLEQMAELLAALPRPASGLRLNEFQELSGHFSLDKGYLHTRDLTLKREDLELRAKGSYGLMDEGLDFDVTLQVPRAVLEARVTGTTSKPLIIPKAGWIQKRIEMKIDRTLKGEGRRLKDLLQDLFR